MVSVKKPKIEPQPTQLRAWREFRNMTQTEAAATLGMDYTNLGKIERGLVPYAQPLLESAAKLYDCSVGDLLERNPVTKKTVLDLWVSGTPEQVAQIESYARYVINNPTEEPPVET